MKIDSEFQDMNCEPNYDDLKIDFEAEEINFDD